MKSFDKFFADDLVAALDADPSYNAVEYRRRRSLGAEVDVEDGTIEAKNIYDEYAPKAVVEKVAKKIAADRVKALDSCVEKNQKMNEAGIVLNDLVNDKIAEFAGEKPPLLHRNMLTKMTKDAIIFLDKQLRRIEEIYLKDGLIRFMKRMSICALAGKSVMLYNFDFGESDVDVFFRGDWNVFREYVAELDVLESFPGAEKRQRWSFLFDYVEKTLKLQDYSVKMVAGPEAHIEVRW